MKPVVLFRNDIDWRQESHIVGKYFQCIGNRTLLRDNLVIARFSAVPFYKELETDLYYVNCRLINSYSQHLYIADLGNWYADLHDFTPMTWRELYAIPEDGQFILKGETNSKKYLWNTHCFAKDKKAAIEVHSRLQNDSLIQYQQIYIRQYVPLEVLADGLQGLPITREYRFFVYKDKILSGGFYWSSHSEDLKAEGLVLNPDEVPREFLNSIIERIQNTEICDPPTYYVIDVAKTAEGKWIVIELNDGQCSGLSDNDPEILYSNLKKALEEDGF